MTNKMRLLAIAQKRRILERCLSEPSGIWCPVCACARTELAELEAYTPDGSVRPEHRALSFGALRT